MPEPFKLMYNAQFIDALCAALTAHAPHIDAHAFRADVFDAAWDSRELKARIRHISVCLQRAIGTPYTEALGVLRAVAADAALSGYSFETMIFPDFVELYGLADWEHSLPALEQFTQQCSAEFAVRPFILQDTPRMMAQMLAWAGHENHHLRRLASEGCRPRLPWGMALPAFKQDPAPILPILERLQADPSEYVRRSVANNLNDIAKDNPQVVIDTLTRWQQQPNPHYERLAHHALRTLVKAGDARALTLLGYGSPSQVAVSAGLTLTPAALRVGERLQFEVTLQSESAHTQTLMIDYGVHFVRANGTRALKVFKLTRKTLNAGEQVTLTRQHSFKPITTRRYYVGEHLLQIQVNGQVVAVAPFLLTEA